MTGMRLGRRCFCGLGLGALLGDSRRAEAMPRLVCNFSIRQGWSNNEYLLGASRAIVPGDPSGIPETLATVSRALGLPYQLQVRLIENADNAFAVRDGGRHIVVADVNFLDRINTIVRTKWAAILVLAHEAGHHFAGWSHLGHRTEMNADYWAGHVLHHLGASRAAAVRGMNVLSSDVDTETHPNRQVRVGCIARGWDDASRGYKDLSFRENSA